MKPLHSTAILLLNLGLAPVASGQTRTVPGHVPPAVSNLQFTGRLDSSRRLHLAISLPVRDPAGLDAFLHDLYNPAGTNFHNYLTPDQFAERFGPVESDYQAIINFANTNGLTVLKTYPNRLAVDVVGAVTAIEAAFHLTLHTYTHPVEHREFYSPDHEPTIDARLRVLSVAGLDNYDLPKPMLHLDRASGNAGSSAGSGPGGNFRGKDFRSAYVPGTTLDGSGQQVGLVEFDGYYASDINTYTSASGLPNARLVNVLLNGFSGAPSGVTNAVGEVSLDIEMVAAMATNLAALVVFEAGSDTGANWVTMLNSMAASNQIRTFSSSWGIGSAPSGADQTLQNMAAQGQTFFQASGDGDAYTNAIPWPSDDPYVISVGGTTLTMSGSGSSYSSETVWNSGLLGTAWFGNGQSGYWGSGGGSSPTYAIPSWQAMVNFNGLGSTTKRNIPDVALTASQVWVNYFNGLSGGFIGTSCAAPLWAGFTALANQQAAITGKPSVGFINYALYAIGTSSAYSSYFHDIVSGNNFWVGSPSSYSAVTGFDLCTGWGTPTTALITALTDFGAAVWVDFTVPGPGIGTFDNPFNTLPQGISAVVNGGAVVIKHGASTSWTGTISKPLTLNAALGAPTIGH